MLRTCRRFLDIKYATVNNFYWVKYYYPIWNIDILKKTQHYHLKAQTKAAIWILNIACRYIRDRLKNQVDSDNLSEINGNVTISLLSRILRHSRLQDDILIGYPEPTWIVFNNSRTFYRERFNDDMAKVDIIPLKKGFDLGIDLIMSHPLENNRLIQIHDLNWGENHG